jgi:hypothetical protein
LIWIGLRPSSQVLSALDTLKRTRRRLHRFGWLVEECNRYQLGSEDERSAAQDANLDQSRSISRLPNSDDPNLAIGRRRSRMVTSFVSSEDGEGGKLFDGASMAEVRSHVIECILMLINAIVGFPDELRHRVQLRAEFIRLQLLDVLGALHRERQVRSPLITSTPRERQVEL